MTSTSTWYDWSLVASTNIYDGDAWTAMEKNGAVFLPAAGTRDDTYVSNDGWRGYYWSATPFSTQSSYFLYIDPGRINPQERQPRNYGFSVRLVR